MAVKYQMAVRWRLRLQLFLEDMLGIKLPRERHATGQRAPLPAIFPLVLDVHLLQFLLQFILFVLLALELCVQRKL